MECEKYIDIINHTDTQRFLPFSGLCLCNLVRDFLWVDFFFFLSWETLRVEMFTSECGSENSAIFVAMRNRKTQKVNMYRSITPFENSMQLCTSLWERVVAIFFFFFLLIRLHSLPLSLYKQTKSNIVAMCIAGFSFSRLSSIKRYFYLYCVDRRESNSNVY